MRATPLIVITVAAAVVVGTIFFKREAPDAPWPRKTVTLLVPFGAGSGLDLSARLFAEKLEKTWGQAVIVDNRPGGGDGILGFSVFAARKDDHTLLFTASGPITMDALIRDDLSFDAREDIVPIASVAQPTIVIAASSTLPVTSLSELKTLAEKNPGTYFWSGIGQLGSFFEAFLKLEKLEMNACITGRRRRRFRISPPGGCISGCLPSRRSTLLCGLAACVFWPSQTRVGRGRFRM